MGHGIAYVALAAGHHVRIHDANTGALQAAVDRIGEAYGRAIERGKATLADRDAGMRRLTSPALLGDAIAGADLAIEAVPERLELKQQLFAEIEDAVGD